MDYYWDKFINEENLSYSIIETKDIEYGIGTTNRQNRQYIPYGNSAGVIDDFLGFGAVNAIESGILAAKAIIENLDYNELLKPMKKHVAKLHDFRKAINNFDNKDFNRLISFLGLPVIKQLIYNIPLIKGQNFSFIAKIYSNIKDR